MKLTIYLFLILAITTDLSAQIDSTKWYKGPIIDMHLHAYDSGTNGPPPMPFCVPVSTVISGYNPQEKDLLSLVMEKSKNPDCENPIWSPETNEELIARTVAELKKYNITGVLSGDVRRLPDWIKAAPDRFIPSLKFSLPADKMPTDSLAKLLTEHKIKIIGEIGNQYYGIAANDPTMDPYWELAETMNIPVAIHLGSGFPGVTQMGYPNYRVKFSNPLQLEDVLNKFPKLRMSVMHYGEPFIDEMIAVLFTYPQVYGDLGGIQWTYPRA